MKITHYLYNAYIIEWDDKKLAIDPGAVFACWFSFASLIPKEEYKGITHIFVTQGDPDHYRHIDKVMNASGVPIIFNKNMVERINSRMETGNHTSKSPATDISVANYHSLATDGSIEVNGIKITGIKTTHSISSHKFGPLEKTEFPGPAQLTGRGVTGFQINYKGKTIVNLGDSNAKAEDWEKVKNPDVLMLPIGGKIIENTLDEHKALEAVKIIRPKLLIPMHYKCQTHFTKNGDTSGELKFRNEVEQLGTKCRVLKKSDSVVI